MRLYFWQLSLNLVKGVTFMWPCSLGVFVHVVLFHLGFRVFLYRMFLVMSDDSRHLNGMSDVVVEFDAIALDLPSGTVLCGQIVR